MNKAKMFTKMMKKYSQDLAAKLTMIRFKNSTEFDYLFGK